MTIRLDELKKVEYSGSSRRDSISPDETLTAIFKVSQPEYVPANVQLRARLHSTMFTGSFLGAHLSDIENDPNVVSLALSRPLPMID